MGVGVVVVVEGGLELMYENGVESGTANDI